MKTLICLFVMFSVGTSFAQVRLQSIKNYSYNSSGNGNLVSMDSIAFTYNGAHGILTNFLPEYTYISEYGISGFTYDYIKTDPDTIRHFSSPTLPLLYFGMTSFEYQASLLTSKEKDPYRFIYGYDGNGNLTTLVTQIQNEEYSTSDSTVYSYNSFNQLIEKKFYILYNNVFNLTEALTYTYNGNSGSLVSINQQYFSIFGEEQNKYKKEFFYNGNQLDSLDFYNYDYNVQDYYLNSRVRYSYINNLPQSSKEYGISLGIIDPEPFYTRDYFYDSQNRITKLVDYNYDDIVEMIQYYYLNDNLLESIKHYYPDELGNLFLTYKFDYAYQGNVGIQENDFISVSIFPNPTNESVIIKTEFPLKKVEIKNLTGQIVLEQQSNEVDLSQLPSGTYFIHGETEQGNFIEKVVKL